MSAATGIASFDRNHRGCAPLHIMAVTMSGADERIFELLACEHGIKRELITGRSRLQGDLGMDGDDAVEFFAAIERDFGTDLSRLYARWDKHFGPEGMPLSGVLTSAVSGGLGALIAIFFKVSGFWAFILIIGAISLGMWCHSRLRPLTAITVDEVIAAVKAGAWPD
jgi:acyl carrier protein